MIFLSRAVTVLNSGAISPAATQHIFNLNFDHLILTNKLMFKFDIFNI